MDEETVVTPGGPSVPLGQDEQVPVLTAAELEAPVEFAPGEDVDPAAPAATTEAPAAPADPNVAPVAQVAPAPAAPAAPVAPAGFRALAQGLGVDLSGYEDDTTALAALVQTASQAQQYMGLAQRIAPVYGEFQQFLAAKQAPPAPAAPAAPPAWMPPEFDDRWLNYVERNAETGLFQAKAGGFVSPDVIDKVQQYADWMGQFQKNPMGVILPAIKDEARKMAVEIYGTQFAAQQRTATVNGIMDANAPWLYQADEAGNRYVDQAGKFIPTPTGARYLAQVALLSKAGVRDPKQADLLARQLVHGEIAVQAAAGGKPAPRPQTVAATTVAPTGVAQRPVPATTPPSDEGLTLTQMLARDVTALGLTADTFESDFQR